MSSKPIFLTGPITEELGLGVTMAILDRAAAGDDPISLYIHSPGGSVSAGLMILDTMNHVPNAFQTVCLGMAMSMAAVIMACGAPGQRLILPNARMMIHQPLLGGLSGKADDVAIVARELKRTHATLIRIVSEATGQSKAVVRRAIASDRYFTAHEAVAWGLADLVVAPTKDRATQNAQAAQTVQVARSIAA